MSLERKLFYDAYDMDATTLKYGRFWGPNPGYGFAKSSAGTSTTVVATASGVGTFSPLVAGDIVLFRTGEGTYAKRKVITPGNDTIVVDATIDLGTGGVPFSFLSWKIGTGADDGAHLVHNYESKTLLIESMVVVAGGGVDMQIEGKGERDAAWAVVFGKNYAGGTNPPEAIPIAEDLLKLRVGLKGGTDFAGTDVVTIALEGAARR